jgi:hypothetical protein
MVVRGQTRQIVHETLSQKYPSQKGTGGVAQEVEHLPSKLKAQVLPKKKKKPGDEDPS